ncbi:sensor histidine kinase [Tranquillimonas alkanivorans]|uniref:histidine kinase n=1 Tax=Tranquillimonas alkanivorans TaxID=441119 RepID=A0A1I5MFS9_9RHOB|nr:sensor histidine kinase N-terminal domain-containing protein [Tranquillimonas alkanivorans]SFP07816.1 two-component system, OmpR family, sensor histidine kinase TctE [Tranquillimonas alkanivorans]
MAETRQVKATLSLKSRVAIAVTSVLVLGGVVVLIAALAYGRQAAREAYDRLLLGAAADIAGTILVHDGVAVVDMPVSAFELLSLAPDDRIRYRVVGPDGKTLTGDEAVPLPPEKDGEGSTFYDGTFGTEPARYVAFTRRFAERSFSGPVKVIVGHTLLARRELARDIAQNALLVLGIAGAAMAVFAWLVVSRALRPLQRIGAALAAREPTDLTPLSLSAPQEVAGMLASLNGFMTRLQRQSVATGNLIGDAAHQLRTPVAAIRAQAQLAASETDPVKRNRIVNRVQERAAGLGHLLDQLLSRAMIIHRADSEPAAQLDLRDVAVETLEACDDLLVQAGLEVELQLADRVVPVRGDALSLTEAGKNLLINALRHGRAPIRLGVSDGPTVRLWVSDGGGGPPAGSAATLSTRFAGAGRSGGSGIGLAIAREVAEGHGGRIRMNHDGARFTVALELPRMSG